MFIGGWRLISARFFSGKSSNITSKDFLKVTNDLFEKAALDKRKTLDRERETYSTLKLKLADSNAEIPQCYTIRSNYKKYLHDENITKKKERLENNISGSKKVIRTSKKRILREGAELFSKAYKDRVMGGAVEGFICEYFSNNFSEHFDENTSNWEITGNRTSPDRKTVYIYWQPINPQMDVESLNIKLQKSSSNISKKFRFSPEGQRKHLHIVFYPGMPPSTFD